MKTHYAPTITHTAMTYKTETVNGLTIAYREAGDPASPKLVLLHGFPSSSHQYRNLIPALADRFHIISPDYPGFGESEFPDPDKLYPKWQAFLKEQQPKTIIFWGQGDIFFTPEGGEAYLTALPNAAMHRLDAGHFAVEDCLDYISTHMHRFYEEAVAL